MTVYHKKGLSLPDQSGKIATGFFDMKIPNFSSVHRVTFDLS